jgi:hypothetical protein
LKSAGKQRVAEICEAFIDDTLAADALALAVLDEGERSGVLYLS